tara:strand:+ start:2175 stop:2690 length:516 start_codon:yes stop_codon:yes gene_type:complete
VNKIKTQLNLVYHRSKAVLMLFALMLLFAIYFTQRYSIAFNGSNSDCLKATVFLIDKWDTNFTNEDIIAFVMNVENGLFETGRTWVKKVAAMPGQQVSVSHDDVIVGEARYALSTSYVLKMLERDFDSVVTSWTMSDEQVFMIGETLTSFDSRYWGPIQKSDVVGKAYAIF